MNDEDKKPMRINPIPALLTVLSAFSGIRKGEHSKQDQAKLSIMQIIFAALICVACLIALLLTLVRHIVG